MTPPLTPALALAYVRELSADVVAAAILDHTGALLAGAEPLAEPARALLNWAASSRDADARPPSALVDRRDDAHAATADARNPVEGATDAGAVFAARASTHAIVVVTGPFALPRLTRHDLRTALGAVSGETIPDGPPSTAPPALVAALIAAAGGSFPRHSAV